MRWNEIQVKPRIATIEGRNFVLGAAARPQQKCAQKDAHFTVLGFTASTGEPLMCAIIFAAKELEYGWVQGLDVFADWVGEEDDLKSNTGGEGKRYPQGPV